MRDELNRYKEQRPLQNDAETTRQIETKIQERQARDEQHELDRLERQRQRELVIAREAKRNYKPPSVEPTSLSTPTESDVESTPSSTSGSEQTIPFDEAALNTRPVYDRSTKPQSRPPVETPAPRVRDFSPVVGQNVVRLCVGDCSCRWPTINSPCQINKLTFRGHWLQISLRLNHFAGRAQSRAVRTQSMFKPKERTIRKWWWSSCGVLS